MKKKRKYNKKILITLSMLFTMICSVFALCKTYAYTYDEDTQTVISDNLIELENVQQTTYNGLTYKVENGIITINNTPTINVSLWLKIKPITLENNEQYMYKSFNNVNVSAMSIALRTGYNVSTNGINLNLNGNIVNGNGIEYNYYLIYITTNFNSNLILKPMLVNGTISPTEFEAGGTYINETLYDNLQNQYDDLEDTLTDVLDQYYDLNNNYNDLLEQYNQLLEDYEDLESNYDTLNENYTQLESDYNTLESDYNSLQENYNNISSLNSNGIWDNIYSLNIYYLKNGSSSTSTFTKQELIDNNYLLNSTLRLSDIAHSINADNYSYRFNINFTNLNMPNYTKNIDINLITNTAWAHSIDFKIGKYNSDGSVSSPTIIYMSASADDIIANSYNINYNWLYFKTVEGYNIQAFYNTYNVFTRIVFDYDANITILDDDIVYLKSNNSSFLMGYQSGSYDSDLRNSNYYEPIISSLNDNINNLNSDINTLQQQIRTLQEGYTMNDLMWAIGSTPFESFKHIWNVNFLGVNIADFILGLLTTFIGLYIVKKFFL